MTDVLLIGGTSDAREIALALSEAGFEVLVSTATGYGESLAPACVASRSGALDAGEMAALAAQSRALVDASHPFAAEASRNAVGAARAAGVPYVRFERETSEAVDGVLFAEDSAQAAALAVKAAGPAGTVLLTVGSRTVAVYTDACRAAGVRCVARVLPVPESLEACAAAGVSPADIVAMQGPTSADLDVALMRHLGAAVLVTKDSGEAGGVPAKLEAAREAGAQAIVVGRPQAGVAADTVSTVGDVVERVATLLASESGHAEPRPHPQSAAADRPTGLVHVYTGDGKGKTTAAVGLAVRAAGAGLRVAFVQFVKGGRESSELASLRSLGVAVTRPAQRSSGLMRGAITEYDRAAADTALAATKAALAGDYDLVVLDEACVAARNGLVDPAELAAVVCGRAAGVEVAMTGRGAPPELLAAADYVTEMVPRKHPFERGVPARKGVEF